MAITSQNNNLFYRCNRLPTLGADRELFYFAVKSKMSNNGWLWIALPKSLRGDAQTKQAEYLYDDTTFEL